MTELLTYLSGNKIIIVGAVGTICESIVIIVNCYRRLKKEKVIAMKLSVEPSSFRSIISWKSLLLWSANPLNLFKKSS